MYAVGQRIDLLGGVHPGEDESMVPGLFGVMRFHDMELIT